MELQANDDGVPDNRLALMFACAHPAIDSSIRAPLILQTVLGLDAAAIASAFLVPPQPWGSVLVRAKTKIRQTGIPFRLPERADLPERLDAVLEAIYAAFAEGWSDPAGTEARRRDLADEAIWLGTAGGFASAGRSRGAWTAGADAVRGSPARRAAHCRWRLSFLWRIRTRRVGTMRQSTKRSGCCRAPAGLKAPAGTRSRPRSSRRTAPGATPAARLAGDRPTLRSSVEARLLASGRDQPRDCPRRMRQDQPGADHARAAGRRPAAERLSTLLGGPRRQSFRALGVTPAPPTPTGRRSALSAILRFSAFCRRVLTNSSRPN